MSTSYPFLALSRRLGIPYGTVLDYSDAVEQHGRDWKHHPRMVCATAALSPRIQFEVVDLTAAPTHGPHTNPCFLRISETRSKFQGPG